MKTAIADALKKSGRGWPMTVIAGLVVVIGLALLIGLVLTNRHPVAAADRVVLLADLKDSTKLGKQLGDATFRQFLAAVFEDVDRTIAAYGGAVHRHVGDEVIATWPVRASGDPADGLSCVRGIQDGLRARRDSYLWTYGAVPEMRCVLHAGPLGSGELGPETQEVTYLGDTLNTAAKIMEVASANKHDVLVSTTALRWLTMPYDVDMATVDGLTLEKTGGRVDLWTPVRRERADLAGVR